MAYKILIYDDDKDILEVTAAILKMRGFEVSCRDNCREITQDVEQQQPDVILMDNWLPDIGGVKAVQFLKSTEEFKNIPVVFFSANSHVEELAREAGADYMLKKPFEIADLQALVTEAAEKFRANLV
ncbi:response regulator [Ferruginibacter sp. HRS2-29]|uniref:response regulator n=1 Tax=Ferruginibacter sp. HRS2-29 TaxID=2487334 RepID=UPI0020CC79D5|nr:response regulator [Ferruginibacter sp. HRS2-29]MCP9749724.1 response regulator [Ferruginibacter sp. HRS2-29]